MDFEWSAEQKGYQESVLEFVAGGYTVMWPDEITMACFPWRYGSPDE
jgi:hypothetical protein